MFLNLITLLQLVWTLLHARKQTHRLTMQTLHQSLPDPLYLFGYGSLIWRPGDLLQEFPSYPCICKGWSRRFAQKSTDHRGNDEFPGLVATMIENSFFIGKNAVHIERKDSRIGCIGVVYLIPRMAVSQLIAELDHREKGGYDKHLIDVECLSSTPHNKRGDITKALVYIGTTDNPQFSYHLDIRKAAAIISVARGPSGNNVEYLLQLCKAVRRFGVHDPHLEDLASEVCLMHGRGTLRQLISDDEDSLAEVTVESVSWSDIQVDFSRDCVQLPGCSSSDSLRVVVWGSNDAGQICPDTADLDKDVHIRARELLCLPGVCPTDVRVVCGGRMSGVMRHSTLHLWGGELETAAWRSSCTRVTGVRVCSVGFAHALVIVNGGGLLAFGDNSFGQCYGVVKADGGRYVSPPFFLKEKGEWAGEVSEQDRVYVTDVAAGLRHSAAVARGKLFTWGDASHCQSRAGEWSPEDGGSVVTVACGARHTVLLDDRNRVWAFGDNRFGQLGDETLKRSDTPRLVSDLEPGVRWARVVCGWSHTVLRGVRQDGSLVFFGWGRSDLGQLGRVGGARSRRPIELAPPLDAPPVRELWCGAEASLACTEDGRLWGTGWNEHGNLGTTGLESTVQDWVPVTENSGRQVHLGSRSWVGSAACGGGHCMAVREAEM